MGTSLILIRLAVPASHAEPGVWLNDTSRLNSVRIAVQLVPVAGIAFLWFMGVLRNRLGELEDQFFATVFFGSGLLFVASLFASAALAGALVEAVASGRITSPHTEVYSLARSLIGAALNVFAIKMAGVFMMSSSTIMLRTAILPRWAAFTGFAGAGLLLLVITNWRWIALVFPLWMLVISLNILIADLRTRVSDTVGEPAIRVG